jgi:hypothetical protein
MPSIRVMAATGTARGRERGKTGALDPLGRAGDAATVEAPVKTGSAWASWFTVLNRSAATGASALRIASSTPVDTDERIARTLGAGSVSRFTIKAWIVAPVKGGSPASIS